MSVPSNLVPCPHQTALPSSPRHPANMVDPRTAHLNLEYRVVLASDVPKAYSIEIAGMDHAREYVTQCWVVVTTDTTFLLT